MENIKSVLKKAQDLNSLITLLEGFNQEGIQIKWYGSRRFKHSKNDKGTISLNDLLAAVAAQAKKNPERAQLQRAISIIETMDQEASRRLKASNWLARKLHFIPHLFGRLFFNREAAKKALSSQVQGGNTQEPQKPNVEKISKKLLFQIHAGNFGGDAPPHFRSSTAEPALHFVHQHLVMKNRQNPQSGLSPTIDKLEKAQTLLMAIKKGDFEEKFKKLLTEAFEAQKPLLVPGGWVKGKNGCAMYYEIIPTSQTAATFRIYDLTRNGQHHAQQYDDVKVKDLSYSDLCEICREKFMAPEFAKAIKEMLTYVRYKPDHGKGPNYVVYPPEVERETNYNSQDVYLTLRSLLKPEGSLDEASRTSSRFMSTPETNVSAFGSLMAFLASELPVNDYKQLKIELKVDSLFKRCQYLISKNKPDIENVRLIEKSVRKTSRAIERLLEKKVLDKAAARTLTDHLKPVVNWLEANAPVKHTQFGKVDFKKIYPDSFKPLSAPAGIAQELKDLQAAAPASPSTSLVADEIRSSSKLIQEGNIQALFDVEAVCKKAWSQKNYLGLQVGLESLIFDLPLDYAFWVQAFDSKDKAKQGIVQLGVLGEYYFKSCLMAPGAQTVSPEKQLALTIIRALQQHCLGKIAPGDQYYLRVFGSKLDFFPDAKINAKFNEYDRMCNSDYEKSMFGSIFFKRHWGSPSFSYDEVTVKAFKMLVSADFDRDCHEKFMKWNRGKPGSYADCIKFYASEALPDWLRAIRNVNTAADALRDMPLNITADADNALEFKFEVKQRSATEFSLDYEVKGTKIPFIYSKIGHEAKDSTHRHLLLFRPFASAKIQAFYKNLIYTREAKEKNWLTVDPKAINVDLYPEEYQELMQLFAEDYYGELDVQMVAVIDFFTRHPEKFKDPDFQTIFQKQLFHSGLDHSLQYMYLNWNTDIGRKATELLFRNYQQMSLANEIQPAVFLLQMMRYLSKFSKIKIALDVGTELHKLLARPGLSNEEKSVVYAELVAYLSEKRQLTHQDKNDLLVAFAFLERYPVPFEWRDPRIEDSLRKAPHLLANALKEHLSSMPADFVQQIIKTLYPEEPESIWQLSKQGESPVFTSATSTYFPLQGVIFLESQRDKTRPLPKAIVDAPDFEFIFPAQKTGQQRAPFIYAFQDVSGREVLIKYGTENSAVVIEQNFQGQWATFIPKNKLLVEKKIENIPVAVPLLASASLMEHFSAWEIPDQQLLYLVDPRLGEIKYKCLNSDKQIKIVRLADQAELSRPSLLMTRVERPDYIHEFYVGETLREIELPRFGLTFTPDSKNPACLSCHQLEGFYFKPEETLVKLGTYSHYLVLENAKGEKKALFPHLDFKSPGLLTNPLISRFEIENDPEIKNLKYIVFDVTSEGLLKSASQEENLYVAEVLAIAQEYALAADYMRRFGPKLQPYSKQELHRLRAIAGQLDVTGDQDPNVKALRTYASYLILKNGQGKERDIKQAAENFRYYLSNLTHVSALKLSSEEEVFLLKTLLNHTFDPVFFLRLEALDPNALALLQAPDLSQLGPKQAPFEFHLPDPGALQSMAFNDIIAPKLDAALLTRLELELKKHFFGYYELARKANDKEQQWLKTALKFNQNFSDCRLGNLLAVVLKYPDAFPAIPQDKQEKQNYTWHASLVEKAKELYVKNPKAFQDQVPYAPTAPVLKHREPVPSRLAKEPTKVSFSLSEQAKPWAELCQDLFVVAHPSHDPQIIKEMIRLLKSWKSSNETFNSELQHQIDDIKALKKMPLPPAYLLQDSERGLEKLEALLVKNADEEKRERALEQEILALANRYSNEEEALLYHELQTLSGVKKPLTLEELIINFGKQDLQFLQERNPALTESEIATLYGKVGDYLLQATREQQRLRCHRLLNDVKNSAKGSLEEAEHLQLLAESLFAKRCFDPKQHPRYLVFEYSLNILIREQQRDKISQLEPNTVEQMLMGEGKTTVVSQMWDGLLVQLESLFASVAAYSQKVHRSCFGKQLRTLHFDRNTTFTQYSLEVILDNLKGAQAHKESAIMTSKSIACLILKYIEAYLLQNREQSCELKLMGQILTLLGKSGRPLIDEIDTVLKVIHEISFSIGNLVPVDECEYATIGELYDILYTDPEIKKLARCESDPSPNHLAPVLTEELYHYQVKGKLAAAFVERLATMKLASQQLEQKVQQFGIDLSKPDKQNERGALLSYLCQKKEHLAEAQQYYNALDPDLQNILALAGEEICRFLPYTLTLSSNENYGLDEEQGLFAIPYAAANTPQKGSEYKNSHITINTTFQMYLKYGIPKKVLIGVIDQLQQRALGELKENPSLDIVETKSWKLFDKIKEGLDFPLLKYNTTQLDALLDHINKDLSSKRSFIVKAILPHLVRYDSSLTFNPQNFISFFDEPSGFSGTLANALTMHHKLKVVPEAGTDAKTLKVLFEKSRKAVAILKSDHMAQELNQTPVDFDVLIDAGGYCKGKESSSMQIARLMSAKSGKKVIVYDEKGIKQEVSADKIAPFKDDLEPGRKTLFDQSRSTGGDIKQKPTAEAIVTIGKNLTSRDLFQAARRMRGLDKGQRVSFWISPEVDSIIKTVCKKASDVALDFDDILFFANYNQSKQLGSHYFKAFKQQLWNVSQMMLLKAVLSASLPDDEAKKAKEMLKAAWLKPANRMPKDLYGQLASEVDTAEAVKTEKERSLKFIQNCYQALPSLAKMGFRLEESTQELNVIEARFAKVLPPKLKIQELDDNQTVEQETQTETEQESEMEVEAEQHVQADGIKLETLPLKKLVPIVDLNQESIEGNYMPLALYFRSKPELAEYAGAFDGIDMTINVLQFTMKNPSPDNLKLFGPNRTPLLNFAIDKKGAIILLSRSDISGIKDSLNKQMSLDNLTLCQLDKFDEATRSAVFEKIVKIKFLNGECNFNKDEQRVLTSWIEREGPAKMRTLYLKHILLGCPLKKVAYNANSDLKKLFKKLGA